jgi:hypothetical protein
MRIAGINHSKLKRLRDDGLLVRDAGRPFILGSDWLEFLKDRPPYVFTRRGRPRTAASTTTN